VCTVWSSVYSVYSVYRVYRVHSVSSVSGVSGVSSVYSVYNYTTCKRPRRSGIVDTPVYSVYSGV
jgi:hypothetical protein